MRRVARATAHQLGSHVVATQVSYYARATNINDPVSHRLSGLCIWDSELHYFCHKKDRSPPYAVYSLTAAEKRAFAVTYAARPPR